MLTDSLSQLAEILSRQPLFRGLVADELELIAQGSREIRIQRNEMLFKKGDEPEGMHVLVMGQVKLSLPSAQGSEKVVHMCEPGSTFGEAVVFLDKPYPVSALATQDSIVLLVQKSTLVPALSESPMLSRKMLASLSLRLHELIDDMETCTLRTSMQRVVCYLTHQAPNGHAQDFVIQLDTSKQTVASQLNLAPETFSRVLGQLSEAGLIEVRGRSITVLDREKLRTFQA